MKNGLYKYKPFCLFLCNRNCNYKAFLIVTADLIGRLFVGLRDGDGGHAIGRGRYVIDHVLCAVFTDELKVSLVVRVAVAKKIEIFLKAEVVLIHIGRVSLAYVSEVILLVGYTGHTCLFGRLTVNKSVLVSVLIEPAVRSRKLCAVKLEHLIARCEYIEVDDLSGVVLGLSCGGILERIGGI